MISISFFLFVTILSFFLGLFGIIFNKRSIILVLLCIELILLSVNINFILFSVFLDDFIGQVFSLFILTVAASESAIGLAILVVYYKVHYNLESDSLNLLQGLIFKRVAQWLERAVDNRKAKGSNPFTLNFVLEQLAQLW